MTVLSHRRNIKLQRSLVIILFCLGGLLFWSPHCNDGPSTPLPAVTQQKRLDRELVVAKRKHEDTAWIGEYLPDWASSIYEVDDPRAQLNIPANKGREAMVYLTYVVLLYGVIPWQSLKHIHLTHVSTVDISSTVTTHSLTFRYSYMPPGFSGITTTQTTTGYYPCVT